MRAVNLLPSDTVAERRAGPKMLPLVAAAAVPVIALTLVIVGYVSAHSAVSAKEQQLALLQAKVAAAATAQASAAPTIDTSVLVAARTERVAALQDALSKVLPWDAVLRDVARVLPPKIWLTELQATSPTPAGVTVIPPVPTTTPSSGDSSSAPAPVATAPAPSTTSFTITGYAYTQDDVALLLERLQLLPSLGTVALGSNEQSSLGPLSVVQFQITAAVLPAKAPA